MQVRVAEMEPVAGAPAVHSTPNRAQPTQWATWSGFAEMAGSVYRYEYVELSRGKCQQFAILNPVAAGFNNRSNGMLGQRST
jgi:hypothetical protein